MPKIASIAEALIEAVVLIVSDAFILGFEFDGSMQDWLGSRQALCGAKPAVADDNNVPIFRRPESRRQDRSRLAEMPADVDVVPIDAQIVQELADCGDEPVEILPAEILIPRAALLRLSLSLLLELPPVRNGGLEEFCFGHSGKALIP